MKSIPTLLPRLICCIALLNCIAKHFNLVQAQPGGLPTTNTCHHSISLYQLSANISVTEVRINSLGNTRIVLAKAPTGFATGAKYPAYVVWSGGTHPYMPQGNPIDGAFELVLEPQYKDMHTFEVSWASPDGVICSKNLEIYCPPKTFLPTSRKRSQKQNLDLVSFRDGMLEFNDSLALYRFYQSLIPKTRDHAQVSDTWIDSLARSMQQRFPGFQPLQMGKRDPVWKLQPLLPILLNQQQALRINGVIFAFDGPYRLHTLPFSERQMSNLRQLIQQRYAKPLPPGTKVYDLLADQKEPGQGKNRKLDPQQNDACNTLFASPSD